MKNTLLDISLLCLSASSFAQNSVSSSGSIASLNSASTQTQALPFYPQPAAGNNGGDGQTGKVIAGVLGAAGGALIGWQLGTAAGGGDPNWAVAGVGAGLIAIAIPISIISNKKAKGYSKANTQTGPGHYVKATPARQLQFIAGRRQAGLRLNF